MCFPAWRSCGSNADHAKCGPHLILSDATSVGPLGFQKLSGSAIAARANLPAILRFAPKIRHMLVALADYNNPRSLGSRLRRRRNRLIVELIDAIYFQNKSVRICDLGGRRAYRRDFGEDYLKSRGVHITLVNFEAEISDAAQDPRFTPVCGDACSLS